MADHNLGEIEFDLGDLVKEYAVVVKVTDKRNVFLRLRLSRPFWALAAWVAGLGGVIWENEVKDGTVA